MLSLVTSSLALTGSLAVPPKKRFNEIVSREETEAMGIVWRGNASHSHDLLPEAELPTDFTWCNKDGHNFCTASLNQHIPQCE